MALTAPKQFIKKKVPKNVPDYLIYEIMDGKPVYYKGYKEVLKKNKQATEITGTATLLWKITSYLLRIAFTKLQIEDFHIATNRPTLHIDNRNNLAGDILIFKKEQIPPSDFGIKYTAVPAMVHIEVDVTADTENSSGFDYLQLKIDKLLAFGTEKIIWIFSGLKKTLVVSQEKTWHWFRLDEPVLLYGEVAFNIGEYLQEEGIAY